MFHIIQFSAPSLTEKLNYTSDIMRHHQRERERGEGERGADVALHSQLGNPCILISCWLNILWFDGRLAASFLASRLAGYGQHPDEHRLDKADRLDSRLHWHGGVLPGRTTSTRTVAIVFIALDNMLGLPYGASRALEMSGLKLTNGKLICREIQYRNLAENAE